jgi:hypothetical protein
MKETFIDWKPNTESRHRLGQIGGVLTQYGQMGIKLTLRQLYYQLVSKNIIANQQREYKRLGDLLSKARLAGLIDWDVIEDRVRRPIRASQWSSIKSLVDSAVFSFRLPRWESQPCYLELWCEKDALSSVLEPICDDRHVTLMVNRGYSSSSAMYDAAGRITYAAKDRPAQIIYLGDFDPSGEDMVRDIRDRMKTFRTEVEVTKLALNPDQIEQYKLPPNPAKMSDSRAQGFVDQHGSNSYEVDALPPEVLQRLVRTAIQQEMDADAYEEVIAEEQRLKETLVKAASKIK